MSESETPFKIVKQTAREFNEYSNRGLYKQFDFTRSLASVDWESGHLYVNVDVVPKGLEVFIAAHEAAELKARKKIDQYEIEAHKRGIDAEYGAAKRSSKLHEEHNFMSSVLRKDIQECEEKGWDKVAKEKRNDLSYREKVYRKFGGR